MRNPSVFCQQITRHFNNLIIIEFSVVGRRSFIISDSLFESLSASLQLIKHLILRVLMYYPVLEYLLNAVGNCLYSFSW